MKITYALMYPSLSHIYVLFPSEKTQISLNTLQRKEVSLLIGLHAFG